jgi:hypothetical protein
VKLQSRKLWLAGGFAFQLSQFAAVLYSVAWVWGGHPRSEQMMTVATTALSYLRDIVVAFIGMNVVQHVGHEIGQAIGRRRGSESD